MEEFVIESSSMIQAVIGLIVLICFFVLVARVGAVKRYVKEMLLIEQCRAKIEGLTVDAECPNCKNKNYRVAGAKIDCGSCGLRFTVVKVVESGQTDKTDKV